MIAIPNMEKPKSCWECFNADCNHWGEHGYDNTADCPLIEIDIVRCGECRYFDYDDGVCRRPKKLSFIAEPTDFCSYGERRAE